MITRDQLFRDQNKYFALRTLSQCRHNFVLIYFLVKKYVYCLQNMPDKRQLVTSNICFGSKIAGLLDHSYKKCPLASSIKTMKLLLTRSSFIFLQNLKLN